MATAAQLAANRANAKKSTGPRTEAGKARSRANALTHGMTGSGVVLPEEDRARWEHRSAVWAQELGARGELDLYLAGRAAMASVRLDRCVRNETATLQPRRAEALSRWQRERASWAKVEANAKALTTDPAPAVRKLSSTVLGCEWLIAAWRELAAQLETYGWWDLDEMRRALNLLGVAALPTRESGRGLPNFWLACLAAKVETEESPTAGELTRFFGSDDPAVTTLPEAAQSAEMLMMQCASELARLRALREALWESEDGPERQQALDKVMVDVTKEGMLRRRYETASTSELHRSIEQIHKNHRAADRDSCEPILISDLESPCEPGPILEPEPVSPATIEEASPLQAEANHPEIAASEALEGEGVSSEIVEADGPATGTTIVPDGRATTPGVVVQNEPNPAPVPVPESSAKVAPDASAELLDSPGIHGSFSAHSPVGVASMGVSR